MTGDDAYRAGIAAGSFLLGAWLAVLALTEPGLLALPLALSGPVTAPLAGVRAYQQALTCKGDR
jgi:hypothetical protein